MCGFIMAYLNLQPLQIRTFTSEQKLVRGRNDEQMSVRFLIESFLQRRLIQRSVCFFKRTTGVEYKKKKCVQSEVMKCIIVKR